MSNDELKKKIVDIIQSVKLCTNQANCDICKYDKEIESYTDMSCTTLRIADALIAAGIGDVKEAERRAEVAERAFVIITTNISRLERGVSLLFAMKRISLTNALLQAEKELAEERKDD